jgi:hypothetical protein
MAHEFEVQNINELEEILNNKDIRISRAITKTILNNLTSKKRNLHALSIKCQEENEVYDISVDRKEFISSLEKCLPNFEKNELYEDCAQIINAIQFLKNKKIK